MAADPADDYRVWREQHVHVGAESYTVATKPGVFAVGRSDPSTMLLATRATIHAGDVVVHLNAGGGLFGAVAARAGAARVLVADRNVVATEAARRTLVANESPHAESCVGHGLVALPTGVRANVVAIRVPQEKAALIQLLHDAFELLLPDGRCYLAGATNEGAKSAATLLASLFGTAGALAHDSGHRIVVAHKRSGEPASRALLENPYLDRDAFNPLVVELRGTTFTLFTRPGVFSWDHIDDATALLANEMVVHPNESVLDLGCGYGALGVVAAALSGTGRVCMVDADAESVRCAAKSAMGAGLAHAEARASDIASAVRGERFDVVVTNPPFHVGKATDLDLPLQFIREAWESLHAGGRMYLVANRTLPYERAIRERFGNMTTLHDGRRFKILSASRVPDHA